MNYISFKKQKQKAIKKGFIISFFLISLLYLSDSQYLVYFFFNNAEQIIIKQSNSQFNYIIDVLRIALMFVLEIVIFGIWVNCKSECNRYDLQFREIDIFTIKMFESFKNSVILLIMFIGFIPFLVKNIILF